MDNQRLRELAGLTENTQSHLNSEDIALLDYLITYYLRGWSNFPDHPDPRTEKVMNAVQHLQGRNLYKLSPVEAKMAQSVLSYGTA